MKTILFLPIVPPDHSVLYKICSNLGVGMSSNPEAPYDRALNWEDTTFRTAQPILQKITSSKVINLECNDISKNKVDQVHQEVFGYGLIINPTVYVGKCVKKTDKNAQHDGIIIDCPITQEDYEKQRAEGNIFVKLVNNGISVPTTMLSEGEYIQDIRVPFFAGTVPLCYIKYRPNEARFSNRNTLAVVSNTETLFSPGELAQISHFCQLMGLDYGELDILRNLDDGKIYIVDVNNTPSGPPNGLQGTTIEEVIARLANAFNQAFLLEKI